MTSCCNKLDKNAHLLTLPSVQRFIKHTCLFLTLLFLLSCEQDKVGDTTIKYLKSDSEILIDRFPVPTYGINGFNTVSYPNDFSSEKLDEKIYNLITDKNILSTFDAQTPSTIVKVKTRAMLKDRYGKDSLDNWITIGSFDISEAKKFAGFQDWNRKYGVFKLINVLKEQMNKSAPSKPEIAQNITAESSSNIQSVVSTYETLSKMAEKSSLKIDNDNGVGQIKFGMDIADVNRISPQGYPQKIDGHSDMYSCSMKNPNTFYLSGRKVEGVTFVYYQNSLLRIIVDLPPYDETVDATDLSSKRRTGNEDVYNDIEHKYGPWGESVSSGQENEVTAHEDHVINGNLVSVRRICYSLTQNTLDPSQGQLMCPGDRFVYTNIAMLEWVKYNEAQAAKK